MSYISPIVVFLILSFIVIIHELGHYLVARCLGVAVKSFVIGVGPVIYSRKDRSGMTWTLHLFPILGYVQFVDDVKSHECLLNQPIWKRALITVAGPLANMLLAIVLMAMYQGSAMYHMQKSRIIDNDLLLTNESRSVILQSPFVINNQSVSALRAGDHILNLHDAYAQLIADNIIINDDISQDAQNAQGKSIQNDDTKNMPPLSDLSTCMFIWFLPLDLRFLDIPVLQQVNLHNGLNSMDSGVRNNAWTIVGALSSYFRGITVDYQDIDVTSSDFHNSREKLHRSLTHRFSFFNIPKVIAFYVDFDLAKHYWTKKTDFMRNIVEENQELHLTNINTGIRRQSFDCEEDKMPKYSENLKNSIALGLQNLFRDLRTHEAWRDDLWMTQNMSLTDLEDKQNLDLSQMVDNYLSVPVQFDLLVQRPNIQSQDSHFKVRIEGSRADVIIFLQNLANHIDSKPWYRALWETCVSFVTGTFYHFTMVTNSMLEVLHGLFFGDRMVSRDLIGIVGIGAVISDVISFEYAKVYMILISTIANLSLSLALLNLLPVPIADGGRLVFLFLENFISQNKLNKADEVLSILSVILLIALFVYVTYNDIMRLIF